MQTKRFDKIRSILRAVKHAETAKLKAKLNEIETARETALNLRVCSARLSPYASAAEMQFQSRHQQSDETKARALERDAMIAEHEARQMQAELALTLGREKAADALATSAHNAERALEERRSETVPGGRSSYLSTSSAGSSVGTE